MADISILGAGGWAIGLALCCYKNGHSVTMWTPFEKEAELLNSERSNNKLLPGVTLPEDIKITTEIQNCDGSALTIIVTPSGTIREVAGKLKGLKNIGIIVNASKGIEKGTLLRLSTVINEELPNCPVVALSGPSHAEEVSRRIPTSVVAACDDIQYAKIVQDMLSSDTFRIYTSDDIIGVELGGALKNVIAICSGICDGMSLGDNSKAALVTRGLSEMARLGLCMGAKEHTFMGLAGIGDLMVTCNSQHSRNNRFGRLVGTGVDINEALQQIGTVEGYYAAKQAHDLMEKYHIKLAIFEECYQILYNSKPIEDIVKNLMLRPYIMEHNQ